MSAESVAIHQCSMSVQKSGVTVKLVIFRREKSGPENKFSMGGMADKDHGQAPALPPSKSLGTMYS